MGMLDYFFKDPFASWLRHEPVRVQLDLEQGSVNGIRPGMAYGTLVAWGRPTNRLRRIDGEYLYGPSGLIVEVSGGNIDYLALLLTGEPARGIVPCQGQIVRAGQHATLSARTSAGDLLPLFGAPTKSDADADETVLHFQIGSLTYEIECDTGSYVKRINLFEG